MAYTNIDDPSAYFQTTLYTGDGNDNRQVTNGGNSDLKPDLVWYKDRTQAESHAVFDSTRGATKRLQPNNSNDESEKWNRSPSNHSCVLHHSIISETMITLLSSGNCLSASV